MKRKTKIYISLTVVISLLIIGIISFIIYSIFYSNNDKPEGQQSYSIEKVEKSLSGKSIDEDKKEILNISSNILKNSLIKTEDMEKILEEFDSGDLSKVSPEVSKNIHFTDYFDKNPILKNTTYISLATMSSIINTTAGNKNFEPVTEEAWKSIYLDQEVGQAFVPLQIFTGTPTAFSLEFVYINGSWKLAPYSLVEAVKLSSTVANSENSSE